MRALYTHFKIEFKNGIRDNTMILMNYLFPLGFYVLMGLLMPKLHEDFKQIMIPGMIAFGILASTVLTIPNMIVSARENNVYRSYKVYGITIPNLFFLIIGTTMVHGVIVTGIIMSTAPIFFESVAIQSIGALLGIALCFMFTSTAIAILIGVCCKNTKVTTLWSQLIFIPSVILGGIMLPLERLPKEVGMISKLIPTTYATVAMREWGMGQAQPFDSMIAMGILLALGIIAIILSYMLFQWDNKNPRKCNRLSLILVGVPILLALFIL